MFCIYNEFLLKFIVFEVCKHEYMRNICTASCLYLYTTLNLLNSCHLCTFYLKIYNATNVFLVFQNYPQIITNTKPRQADSFKKYKIKQIPKMDIFCLWNKDEISPTPLFSCFSWISRIQDVHFRNLFYFVLQTQYLNVVECNCIMISIFTLLEQTSRVEYGRRQSLH